MRLAASQLVIEQGTGQKDQPGEDANPVKGSESAADEGTSKMPRWQHRERGRGNCKSEEQKPANPNDQRQEHQESKKGHADIIAGALRTDNFYIGTGVPSTIS